MKRVMLVVVLACILSGCAGGAASFGKPGVSEGQRERDYFDCELQAGQAAGNDDFRRIMYLSKCMHAKGYNN